MNTYGHLLRMLSCLIMAGLFSQPFVGNAYSGTKKIADAAADSQPSEKQQQDSGKTDTDKDEKPKESAVDKKQAGPQKSSADEKVAKQQDASKADKKDTNKKKTAKKKTDVKEVSKTPKSSVCKKPTYKLKKGPFIIKVTLKGTFEAQKMTEVVIRPQQWSGFTVLQAVEHGERVKQGDLLVSLDPEKIDRAIADMRMELHLAELALKKAEKELQGVETVTPIELAALERSERIAGEDYDYFFAHELPFARETVRFLLKSRQNYLDYQKEELRQLEKMYNADEITEETEEIILRRTRDAVAEAEFYLKGTQAVCDRALKFALPRQEDHVKDAYKRRELKLQAGKVLLPLELEKKRIEFERMQVRQQRAEKKLKEMLHDRSLMTIKAPADGIVYYGRCVNGKWIGGQADGRFDRDSSLPTKQAFMTIVQPRPMRIVASVPEKQLHNVQGGLKGTARPTGYPDMKLEVIVDSVAAVPNGSNFPAKITVALDEQAEPLMPGMSCEVKLIAYQKKDALSVPLTSVQADPLDEDKHFVHVIGPKGKDKRREVVVGRRNGKKVEILKGLKPGDKILLVCPKDKKSDDDK